VARGGQAFPASTRTAVLDADAVLVAGAEEPALAEVMAELDLRARVTEVRFGRHDAVSFVAPLDDDAAEWALEAAFRVAESRSMRLAVVGDAAWNDLADAVALGHDHVEVEHLSPRVALPLAAFNASRFDVVAVAPAWAEPMVEIAAAPATARVAAHGLLAEHGPSLFVPSPDGGFAIAGHGSPTRAACCSLQQCCSSTGSAARRRRRRSQAPYRPRSSTARRRRISCASAWGRRRGSSPPGWSPGSNCRCATQSSGRKLE